MRITAIFLASCILLLASPLAPPAAAQPTLDEVVDATPTGVKRVFAFFQSDKLENFLKFIWQRFLALLKGIGSIFNWVFNWMADALHRMLELPGSYEGVDTTKPLSYNDFTKLVL